MDEEKDRRARRKEERVRCGGVSYALGNAAYKVVCVRGEGSLEGGSRVGSRPSNAGFYKE